MSVQVSDKTLRAGSDDHSRVAEYKIVGAIIVKLILMIAIMIIMLKMKQMYGMKLTNSMACGYR